MVDGELRPPLVATEATLAYLDQATRELDVRPAGVATLRFEVADGPGTLPGPGQARAREREVNLRIALEWAWAEDPELALDAVQPLMGPRPASGAEAPPSDDSSSR